MVYWWFFFFCLFSVCFFLVMYKYTKITPDYIICLVLCGVFVGIFVAQLFEGKVDIGQLIADIVPYVTDGVFARLTALFLFHVTYLNRSPSFYCIMFSGRCS